MSWQANHNGLDFIKKIIDGEIRESETISDIVEDVAIYAKQAKKNFSYMNNLIKEVEKKLNKKNKRSKNAKTKKRAYSEWD